MTSLATRENTGIAQEVLEFFATGAEKDWQAALTKVEDDQHLVSLTVSRVADLLDLHGWTEPVGTYIGSYVTIKDHLPESKHDDAIEAIRLLKEEGRLVQLGRGRGKALVVLNSTEPLPAPEERPRHSESVIDADAALRAIRDSYLNMQSQVQSLQTENDDLKLQLASAEERIKQLYLRLDGEVPAVKDW